MSELLRREQNYETVYAVAASAIGKDALSGALKSLLEGIVTIDEESDENVEAFEYWSHKGSSEEEVTRISKKITVTGHRMVGDEAQDLIAGMEFETGSKRDIWLSRKSRDGVTFIGRATVSNIKIFGGDANGYRPFECEIAWKGKPEKTQAEV